MKVSEVVKVLESVAPPYLAADWDNVGLLVGDRAAEARKLLLCIDLTEAVLAEAVRTAARMVMAYHPVIFKPLGRVTAEDSPTVYQAARQGIAVYSMHTAYDAAPGGTNDVLADVLGLTARRPLEATCRRQQCKIVVFTPPDDLHRVCEAAFAAGAGRIGNYRDCAFFAHGIGAFCGEAGSHPTIGQVGQHEAAEELRLEIIAPLSKAASVCDAIRAAHSYETPAIDVYPLADFPEGCGAGRVGLLARPATVARLIARVKKATGLKNVLVAQAAGRGQAGARAARRRLRPARPVTVAACAAGAGGSLVRAAAAAGAQFYLTGELRHHDALAATAAGMTVVCLGHSNSERIALTVLARRLSLALPKLAVALSQADADPFESQ
jgi:dinuclear metal center YbgI/SA1388 family protein